MNFILDSGSGYLLVTNLEAINELNLRVGEEIELKGLGNGFQSTAYYSKGNHVRLGRIVNENCDVVILHNSELKLSQRMGMPIHGVIGYDIFKNLVLDINYKSKRIKFYNPDVFKEKAPKSLKKFQKMPLRLSGKKSFLEVKAKMNDETEKKLNLLIDTGSWAALWLFEKKEENLKVPDKNVDDFLGYGLSGPIHGKRARLSEIELASEKLLAPTTSFPDSLSLSFLKKNFRDGTVGNEVLRRFRVIFDYQNQSIYFKKTKAVKDKFYYNMAGLELAKTYPQLPIYEVSFVRKNSPAEEAGLKVGDIIQNINFQSPEEVSLNDIFELFRRREGTKINIEYTRENADVKSTSFVLKRLI